LKLLNALCVLNMEREKQIKLSVWEKIAKKAMPSSITAKQCKMRNYRLRYQFQRHKAVGSSRLTRRVFAKMCEMHGYKCEELDEVDESPEPEFQDICRCCGQIDDNLIDLDEEVGRLEWFLAFTGLAEAQIVHPYTKICLICGDKLAQAQKFRELCLMGGQIIQAELDNAPPGKDLGTLVKELVVEEDEIENAENTEEPEKFCATCGDMVPQSDFNEHMRCHTKRLQLLHTCKVCGKSFRGLQRYKVHVEYHVDGKTHECPECPQKFNCMALLRKHKRTHKEREKPVNLCTLCGKVYDTASALKYHMNTHNGVKPYKCPDCDQRFARIFGLNNHVNSQHKNVRFKCKDCDMEYIQKGKLALHTVLRHQGAILRCISCDFESTALKT
jgi:Zinc finger, C2H2 type/C2H2-type zinc finger